MYQRESVIPLVVKMFYKTRSWNDVSLAKWPVITAASNASLITLNPTLGPRYEDVAEERER